MTKSVTNAMTSERALLIAMNESGRPMSLATLAKWREQGLLPPFTSSGLGQGKGRSYFWHERTIFPHAAFAYDMIRAGRANSLPICLWVVGFPVSTHLFRRAWLHNARSRKSWGSKTSVESPLSAPSDEKGHSRHGRKLAGRDVLLQTLLLSVGSLDPTRSAEEIDAIRIFFQRLSLLSSDTRSVNNALEQQISAFWMVWNTIEKSDLVATATDFELVEAQRFMPSIASVIEVFDNVKRTSAPKDPPYWTPLRAETLGAPLFGLTLALLRAGYRPHLELTSQRLDELCASKQDEKQLKKTAREICRLWSSLFG